MIEAVVFDDPAPGTTVTLGDGLVETYLGHGIWQTISSGANATSRRATRLAAPEALTRRLPQIEPAPPDG